jgi:hypothetical protein
MLHNVGSMVDGAVSRALSAAQTTPTQTNPLQVSATIRKLFMLLHGSYGTLFLAKFSTGERDAEGRDKGIRAAMKVWDAKLSNFAPEVVETAADRLSASHPQFPPNLPEFEALCVSVAPRKTYAQEAGLPRLPAPAPAAPMEVSFELRGDGKDWARRILARHEAGDKIRPYTLQCARQALGLEGRMSWQ